MEKKNEIEFDLVELLFYMKKRLWIIIATVLVFTMGGYLVSKLIITPTYTASARVYVMYDAPSEDANPLDDEYTQQLVANQLRNDCVVLLSSKNITSTVIENLDLNMSAGGLSNKVLVEPDDNTRVLVVSYTDTNPQRAARIVNEICNVGRLKMEEMIGVSVLQVVDYAEVPGYPSSPSPSRNAIVAAILGLVGVISVMVIAFLMDDSIRTEADIEHYLGLSTLAEVPISSELDLSQRGGELRRSRTFLNGNRK